MLISKEVEVGLNPRNIKYFENLGYEIPKRKDNYGRIKVLRGTKIKVKVEDLTIGSNAKVEVKCDCPDCKEPYLKPIKWIDYLKCVHEDGKYYCRKCAIILYGNENYRLSRLKNSKSFEQWCIENSRQDILDRWDYELNNCKPNEISYYTQKKYYFKCPKGIHPSELKNISGFVGGEKGSMYCKQCNSFAQWGIDNICEDFLEKYWSDKNTVNPWEISYSSCTKVFIICQNKTYHEDYNIICSNFIKNHRCPYCRGLKVHPLDSLGKLLENKGLLWLWSDKNKNSPYIYTINSGKKVWWKCENGKHDDYERSIDKSNRAEFRCLSCVQERNESFLQEKVRLYLESLGYTILHERECTIIPLNPKVRNGNNTLPFDNEVKELKLIIEVHGKQHYKLNGFHLMSAKHNNTTPEYELHRTQLHDRYKKFIAYKQGYSYLEIPYLTDNVKEEWKQLINEKLKEVNN